MRARGIFRGAGAPGKVAFLYTGQGSQYANMLRDLRSREPIVADTFDEADAIMAPLLEGRRLSDIVFADPSDPDAMARAEQELRRTEITQPAVLTVDIALTRLLGAYGIAPDLVMGHSLGEYGALVAAGSLSFESALEAVSARGREMASIDVPDPGAMAAVMAPLDVVEQVVAETDGYVVLANVNSMHQVVLGGATEAVGQAVAALAERGHDATPLPVSHAFHTSIVAPASGPLRATLERLGLHSPRIPIVANVDGEFYPSGEGVEERMIDLLSRQVASPVQFVKGLRTLYDAGARIFVEVGPKKALQGFASDVLGDDHVLSLASNHPKPGDLMSFNTALSGLYAAGLGASLEPPAAGSGTLQAGATAQPRRDPVPVAPARAGDDDLSHLFAEFLERGRELMGGGSGARPIAPVVITGAALGLPGAERVFDDANVARLLNGEQGIDVIPGHLRREMLDKHITRLVKGDNGNARFETIDGADDVIKLAGRAGAFDLHEEFDIDAERVQAFGRDTQLAIAAGIDALRDAGLPLVQHYRTTTTGTQLPDRWGLPEALRDDTGVIFASAFPGLEEMTDEVTRQTVDRMHHERLDALNSLRDRMLDHGDPDQVTLAEVDRRIHDLSRLLEHEPYEFDRRFLFRVLSMGHSQFAEAIGARGPNTQINSACASTTQAVAIAEDWIRAGRCRRVIVVAADDATSDTLISWLGAGFLASGAAATDAVVEDAAVPFDRRRHGMIMGMGAAALVVESAEAARERGLMPICEVLGSVTANSAFHGTRLDVDHISQVMEDVVAQAEARGVRRDEIAGETVFVSHETYTPARGGSAAAEIHALRAVFGAAADQVVIANVKGYTGHPMAVGLEDVLAVKALETGIVPAVPNFRDPDPELGTLNLSHGGAYPVRYALRLAAGFGSQISMLLLRWTPVRDGRRRHPEELGYAYRVADADAWSGWLQRMTGYEDARLEVAGHRLRVADQGPAAKTSAPAAVQAPTPPAPAPIPAPAPAAPPVVAAPPVAAPAPAPAAPASVAAPPAPEPAPAGDDVPARVLAVVAEQTGYPPDLLDMDLDLEADLGIDTVKQAEVFAAIRETYGIERDDTLKLRDYPTINHVVKFVHDRTPHTDPTPTPEPTAQPAPEPAADDVPARVLAVVAEQTGYPPDLLDMDLDLEADLGIDTVKQAEVFAAIRETYGIERDDTLKLRDYPTINHVVKFVHDRTPHTDPTPTPEPTAQPAPEPAADDVPARVLAVVAEQTGYPPDLLDMDLDLEADLGIDTVKQAEVFAAIRETYGIERDDTLKLRDYPTINHVVKFVHDRTPHTDPTPTPEPTAQPAPEPEPAPAPDAFARRLPVPVVRPPLAACVESGVALGEGSRVVLMPDTGGIATALSKRLAKRHVEVLMLDPALDEAAVEQRLAEWSAAGPIEGVYWLPALDDEGPLAKLSPAEAGQALRVRVKLLAVTMRALAEQVASAGSFLVAATRMGGRHGCDAQGATSALGGAVTGFAKALARERADALVKAVDFPPGRQTAALADILIEETLRDPGAVEVGHADDLRWTVGLIEQPAIPDPARALTSDTVFVVTGAAGSIVSAITSDLAAASGGTFHLLDLVPAPDAGDPDLARLDTDPDGLKRDLADRLRDRGERPTPKLVERELARIERAGAALAAVTAIESAGGRAHWHQVDLTDADAVARALAGIARVDVLMHAAGLEISHFLPDKRQSEFDLVFDVKAGGWLNLLRALGDTPIGSAVVFSSIAGRFGNAGQTDYAAANDLLCKSVSQLRRAGTRGIALDWTAWAGIGMASRGSIPKMMEAAGIDMLPAAAGVPVVRRELTAEGPGAEIVVAGALGVMLEERHATGGLTPDLPAGTGPMTGRITAFTLGTGLTVRTELDPGRQPFLNDHRIDGTPVLPGVMGMEGFAEAAHALLPGWQVVALEDVELLAPVKFYRDEPRTLELHAQIRDGDDGTMVADCQLVGRRPRPGQQEQETLHFTGRARLSRTFPAAPQRDVPESAAEGHAVVGHAEVYRVYFHGPAYQVLESAWRDNGHLVGAFATDLPPGHEPAEPATEFLPRLIELCFQTLGVWELGTTGRLWLPSHVDRVLRYAGADDPGALWAVVTPRDGDGGADAEVVDASGHVRVRLEGYRTIELPGSIDSDVLAPLRDAMASG